MATNLDNESGGQREEFTQLDWITLKNDIGSVQVQQSETAGQKFERKFKENPLVPIGCGLTATALCFGLWNFSHGRSHMSQKMMRMRIAAQGFTVVALMLGIVKSSMSN